jgi:hypothetical protein
MAYNIAYICQAGEPSGVQEHQNNGDATLTIS